VYSSSIRGIGGDFVLAQMLAGVVGVAQDLVANVLKALAEERELALVHVILFRCLEDVILRQFARRFLHRDCIFGGHASIHP
jgi:hypothetical protein